MSFFRVPVLENFAWQEPVIAIVAEPSLTSKGTRYLVAPSATGAFVGQDGKIAWMDDAGVWYFDTPSEGWKVYDRNTKAYYVFDGSIWSSASIMDGLTLTGDVDSTQAAIDWDLIDNDPSALSFDTASDVSMLNFNTTDGAEVLSTDATLKVNSGKIDLTPAPTNVELGQATNAMTFSYDSTSILTIDTTNRRITVDKDMVITGDLVVQGETTTIQTTELVVEDKMITLNKGGLANSAGGAGLEFEEDGVGTGYIKVSADRNDIVMLAPANENVLTINIDAISELNMQADLTVEGDSAIDQDLTKDSTTVEFAKLTLKGSIDLSDALAGDVTIASGSTDAFNVGSGLLKLDTSVGAAKVTTNGSLVVDGSTTLKGDIILPNAIDIDLLDNNAAALSFDSSSLAGIMVVDTTTGAEKVVFGKDIDVAGDASVDGNINLGATSTLTDGTKSITVAAAAQAYSSRAQYDSDLKVMRFVDPSVYVAV